MNNPNFNPTDPRDGVFLTSPQRAHAHSEENKAIVRDAVGLYVRLVAHAISHDWAQLHNFASIPSGMARDWLDPKWLAREVLRPIRTALAQSEIVETANGRMAAMRAGEEVGVWFPTAATRDLRERIWSCASDWFPHLLPAKDHVEFWHSTICTRSPVDYEGRRRRAA